MTIPTNYKEFLSILELNNELLRISSLVDWKYEIGSITRAQIFSESKSKALLFENIKDYNTAKVLTNVFGSVSRIALSLGMDINSSIDGIAEQLIHRTQSPQEPIFTDYSPVYSNVYLNGNIDLYTLPIPWWNPEDVDRYIGTWHINITKELNSGNRNIGCYRMQLAGKNEIYLSVSPKSDLMSHLHIAEKKDLPLEMAVAIGVAEPLVIAAGGGFKYGIDEYKIAGGLLKSPVKLVKCKTVDVEVPAESEIIIEGKIIPNKRVKEGPFLDYAGVPSINPKGLVFRVSCLAHKQAPIFRGACVGYPGAEDHLLYALVAQMGVFDFHSSKCKKIIQCLLLKRHFFRAFQITGKIRRMFRFF